MDFLLKRDEKDYFDNFLGNYNLTHKVLVEDLGEGVEQERIRLQESARRTDDGRPTFSRYMTLHEIHEYLYETQKKFPELCDLISIGTTYNLQKILMLTISNKNSSNLAVMIDGGMHGREWTGVMATVYLIDCIVYDFNNLPEKMRSKNWYFIPVLNPDGFDHSRKKDRFWRKNYRKFSGPCDGVDINRNFAYGWGLQGSSKAICSDVFAGITEFSEVESIAIRKQVDKLRLLAYVSVHSYGGKVLFPYALNGKRTMDAFFQEMVAGAMAQAMSSSAERYVSGTATQVRMVRAGGLSIDWMYNDQGVTHAYVIETRGGSINGFLLSNEEILPAVKDVYRGILAMIEVARPDIPLES